ncbi:MAG: tRNA (N6-isopentenyl adenosine(37)-C2)-methylthiotransferase MiaB [Thermodesulfobacteriota bacterium]
MKTFGCQMNKYDSDSISQALIASGYAQTQHLDQARVILVNTCTVREKAEAKALTILGRLASLKRCNPERIIGVVGCVAQDRGMELFSRFPNLDLVLGPRNIHRVVEYISRIREAGERICAVDILADPVLPMRCGQCVRGKVTSFLKIMEGCDNFCTYCIVPYVRGREASVPGEQVIDEADYLVSQGIKEITLIGQNVNSYNGNGALRFPALLRKLDAIPGLKRLRFTTSHPKDLSDDLIQCFGELKSLCSHIHLPVQSGSDNVLGLMHRGYTMDRYISLIERLRSIRPDIAITTDVIVGFPGETASDFEQTLRLLDEIQFDSIFSFRYSERNRTLASRFPNKVDEREKQRRLHTLQLKQREITLRKNKLLEGKIQHVLVEGRSRRSEEQLTGRTTGNKVVNFSAKASLNGQLVMTRIIEGFQNSLLGEVAE